MKPLRKILASRKSKKISTVEFQAPLRPETPFFAVGDIHGRSDLLHKLLDQIREISAFEQIVLVGDYLDRGEQSARVLRELMALQDTSKEGIVCLKGNHEEMCLQFLEDPEQHGPRWFRFGGLQTLASFGLGFKTDSVDPARLRNVRDDLMHAMGSDLVAWLHALPSSWVSGNIAVVHAGANPDKPISDQSTRSLLWGHSEFESMPRSDGIWVIHGHTIVERPKIEAGRIQIDTGAYATGCLTAAHVTGDGVSFLST